MNPRDRGGSRDEHGVVLVWFALTLTLMLFFAAFMVDLGYWYQQSQDIQRTVDAAALAGSTYLPASPGSGSNPATCVTAVPQDAYCAALKVVLKNGYNAAAGGNATLTTAVDASNNHQLDVTLTTQVSSFFASAFMGNLTFSRTSQAQFSQAIPLGSPQNYFGTGSLTGWPGFNAGSTTTDFYATIMGYCVAKENGDEYSSGFDYNANTNNGAYDQPNACNSAATPTNEEWDGTGYEYDVTVPPDFANEPDGTAPATTPVLWVYNPSFSPCEPNDINGLTMDVDRNLANEGGACGSTTKVDIHYELFPPTGPAFAPASNGSATGDSVVGQYVNGSIQTNTRVNGHNSFWWELAPLNKVGTWRVVVSSVPVALDATGTHLVVQNPVMPYAALGDYPFGEHRFALMATESGSFQGGGGANTAKIATTAVSASGANKACTSAALCPEIYANTNTGMAVTVVSPSASANGSAATAYLADIPTTAAGKQVELDLYDPGDYGKYIQILDPTGTPLASFEYAVAGSGDGSVPNPPLTATVGPTPQAATTAMQDCLDVNGNKMLDENGNAVVGWCYPVDGCVSGSAWTVGSAYVACPSGPPWPGGPDHLFGMAQYNDAMVKIFFSPSASLLPNQDNWFGIKEVTAKGQKVNDTMTVGLKVSGLPPHLTP